MFVSIDLSCLLISSVMGAMDTVSGLLGTQSGNTVSCTGLSDVVIPYPKGRRMSNTNIVFERDKHPATPTL